MRIPEPAEIVAWARQRPRQVSTYFSHPERQVLWALLALAAVLRLAYLDVMPFRFEHASVLRGALHPFEQFASLQQGTSPNPFLSLILAVPVAITRDPRLVAILFTIANVVAFGMLYSSIKRYLGMRIAVFALLLICSNAWAILFARRVAPEALVLPLSTLGICLALRATVERRASAWILLCVALAVMLGISSSAVPLVFSVALAIVLYRRRVSWLYLAFGI